ncbi:MAG: hypothetical protein KJ049_11670 [Gammaproteobacteria bacterium]|nr:hypothetical protein [Gammaproteobacteria bacterium]
MQTLVVKRLRTGNIYKILAIGLASGCIPICIVFGLLASVDLMTLNWNGQPVSGARALVVGPLLGVLFALLGTAIFGSAAAFGLWLYSKFQPLEIEYEEHAVAMPVARDG